MENMFCLIDSNRGIYIPQQFAKNWGPFSKGITDDQMQILLSGPDNDDYWDTWIDVVDDVVFFFDGVRCTLYEDNDLWAVPVN